MTQWTGGRPCQPILTACFLPRSLSPRKALLRTCFQHIESDRLTLPFAQTSRAPRSSCEHAFPLVHPRTPPMRPSEQLMLPSQQPTSSTNVTIYHVAATSARHLYPLTRPCQGHHRRALVFRQLPCSCDSYSGKSTYCHPLCLV
jgi:hypothetical protein